MQKKQLGNYILTSNKNLNFEIARGTIYQGLNHQTQQKVWILVSKIDKVKNNDNFQQEIHFYKQTKHKNIIHLLDSYQTKTNIYTIFEACETNLYEFVKRYGFLSQNEAFNIIKQILQFFQEFNRVHCNLSPQKIFIQQGIVKLSGFSYLTKIQEKARKIKHHQGLSPEIISDDQINQKSDIWSLGVILYFMLFGDFPFNGIIQMTKDLIMMNYKKTLKKNYQIINFQNKNQPKLENKDMTYQLECFSLINRVDMVGKIFKFLFQIKTFIENYELESIHPDIQYSNLIYGELNSLLQGSQEFNFEQKWQQLQEINQKNSQQENYSLFTIDEFETENGSLSFGDEFNQSYWLSFKHIIKILQFIKNTIHLLQFIPQNIDIRVPVFCLHKYIMIQLENIQHSLDNKKNFLQISDFDGYLTSIEYCAQQRIIKDRKFQYETQYLQAYKNFQNCYYKHQNRGQQSKAFFSLEIKNQSFKEIKAVYRQPLFNLVNNILEIVENNKLSGILYDLEESQKLKLLRIAYRLLYCQLVNRLFPYQQNGLFNFEKLNLYLDKIDCDSLLKEIKEMIKKFFGV